MGSALVGQAYLQYPNLPHAAMRALVKMALTAKDQDMPPRYWAGWEEMAHSLGYHWEPITPSMSETEREASGRATQAAKRAVDRVVRALVKAGAISRRNVPMAGKRAEYALNL